MLAINLINSLNSVKNVIAQTVVGGETVSYDDGDCGGGHHTGLSGGSGNFRSGPASDPDDPRAKANSVHDCLEGQSARESVTAKIVQWVFGKLFRR